MATTVNIERAVNKLRQLATELHRPLRDVLDSEARNVAIEFAKFTQPFGTGEAAKSAGEKAVVRDIYKVYATPGKAWADINNNAAAGAFWRAFKQDNIDEAQRILNEFGNSLRGCLIEGFDGGAAHKAARNEKTGRVNQRRPSIVVREPKLLQRYVEEEIRHVGTAKGAWADVARQISGSIRGLRSQSEGDITANWITRKGAGFGSVSRSGSDENPVITINSTIPYARNVLNSSAQAFAMGTARRRMIKNLETAVRFSTRNLRSAA